MRCDEARAALGHEESDEVREHVSGCAECQAYARNLEDLGALLDTDTHQEVRPGFDTRFFARLEEEKQAPRRSFLGRFGWLFASAATAAAAVAGFVVLRGDEQAEPEGEDLALAMHLDLLEDFDVVTNLEEVEAFELLADAENFEELLEQGG